MAKRKWGVLIDFDGVLNSYASGWCGADSIPDPPVPGAIEWLRHLVAHSDDLNVMIYSTRSGQPGGVLAMRVWLLAHGLSSKELGHITFPTEKVPAIITIDDRAYRFEGDNFPDVDTIRSLKPWWKK